jgi:hypothetical protein
MTITRVKRKIKKELEKQMVTEQEKPRERKRRNSIGNIAVESMIIGAVRDDAVRRFPDRAVELLGQTCRARIQSSAAETAHAIGATGKTGGELLKNAFAAKVVAGVVAVSLTAGGFAIAATQSDAVAQAKGAHESTSAEVPYEPVAEIVFEGSTEGSQTNPTGAHILLLNEDGSPLQWILTDNYGTAITSGEGDSVTDEIAALSPGEYVITWSVANQDGNTARVVRSFRIIN